MKFKYRGIRLGGKNKKTPGRFHGQGTTPVKQREKVVGVGVFKLWKGGIVKYGGDHSRQKGGFFGAGRGCPWGGDGGGGGGTQGKQTSENQHKKKQNKKNKTKTGNGSGGPKKNETNNKSHFRGPAGWGQTHNKPTETPGAR